MNFGVVFPGGTPTQIVDLAVAAEAAGWDGVFCFEGIYHYDPWSILSAIAMRTERVRLGTMLTPAPRRRPWKLAAECVTLDQLSKGRTILSVGVGAFGPGLGDMNEEKDLPRRAAILDETITLLRAMWKGEPLVHRGDTYEVDLPAGPKAVQKPSIPIWCVGVWPREQSMRRVLDLDGVVPQMYGGGPDQEPGADMTAQVVEWIRARRTNMRGFDVIAAGNTPNDPKRAAKTVRPHADAGATWWMEADWSATPAKVRRRIEAGPPQL